MRGGPASSFFIGVIFNLFDVCSIADAVCAVMRRLDRDG
jgi:hypothetical protein